MKMILNKNEAGLARSLLIFLIGLLVIGAALRSRSTADGAFAGWLPERLGTLLRPTFFMRELTQLAGFACRWLRDFAGVAAVRSLPRSWVVPRDAGTQSRADAP